MITIGERINELLADIYERAEALKLLAWYAVERQQDELEMSGEIEQDGRLIDAEASFDGKVLSITINDVLPRRQSMKPLKSASLLREYWMGNVARAIRRLKTPVSFGKALCCIKIYTPKSIEWDVDNRAINMVINALCLSHVIPNDSWDKLSLLIEGGVDRKRPRTEIKIMGYLENTINEGNIHTIK